MTCRAAINRPMPRLEDEPAYRLGVAIGLLRGLTDRPADPWLIKRARDFVKAEDARGAPPVSTQG